MKLAIYQLKKSLHTLAMHVKITLMRYRFTTLKY